MFYGDKKKFYNINSKIEKLRVSKAAVYYKIYRRNMIYCCKESYLIMINLRSKSLSQKIVDTALKIKNKTFKVRIGKC